MLIFPPRPEDFKFAEAKSPRLRIVSYSDMPSRIIVRGLTKTGLIHDTFLATANRLPQTRIIALTEIPLTILIETPPPDYQGGQLYVQAYLEVANVPAVMMAAGYVTGGSPLSWPGSPIQLPTDGPGVTIDKLSPVPAAGNDFTFSVPINTLIMLTLVKFDFTTSADVADRECVIRLNQQDGIPFSFSRPTTIQPANTEKKYVFSNYNVLPATIQDWIAGPLVPIFLRYEEGLHSSVANMQVLDEFSNIYIRYQQWLDPAQI